MAVRTGVDRALIGSNYGATSIYRKASLFLNAKFPTSYVPLGMANGPQENLVFSKRCVTEASGELERQWSETLG